MNELPSAGDNYYQDLCNKFYYKNNIQGRKLQYIAKLFLGKTTDSTAPPISDGKNVAYTNSEKFTALTNFFLCNSQLEDNNAEVPPYSHKPGPVLSNITVTMQDVWDILKYLNTNKATGADGVSLKMLMEAAPFIAESLTKLIEMSLDRKIYPKSWKWTNVLTLFKKNDTCQMGNYRAISPLIRDMRIIFCDTSKDFDRVWHQGLLYELNKFGIKRDLLQRYCSCLQNRCQSLQRLGLSKPGCPRALY